MEPFVCVSPT
jgi:hypothetical protein